MAHSDCRGCGDYASNWPNCCDWAMMEDRLRARQDAAQKDAERLLYDKHKAELSVAAKYIYHLKYYGKKM